MLDSVLSVHAGGCPLVVSASIHLIMFYIVFGMNIVSNMLQENIVRLNRLRSGGQS